MTAKEQAIKRIAIFIRDRVDFASRTGNSSGISQASLEELIGDQLRKFPDGGKAIQ